jgi:hypothetical protein
MPLWMRDVRKAGPLLVLCLGLLVLLLTSPQVKPPSETTAAGAATDSDAVTPTASTAPTAGPQASPVGQPGLPGSRPSGVTAPAGAAGFVPPAAVSKPGSGQGAGGGGASYQGVLDKSIRMGFTWQHQSCGNYTDAAVAAGFGVPQPDPQTSISSAIAYFERFPERAFPNLSPELARGVSAKTGYWGRRLQPIYADNGGPLCADKARATATQLAEQDKAFGTVQIPNDGANQYLAQVMAAHHLIDIGAPGLTRKTYDQYEPYVYDVTFSGSDVVAAWSSYACRDLVGKTSTQTGDPTTAGKKRAIAVVYPDQPLAKALTGEARAGLKRCGADFAVSTAYPTDVSQQGAAASNAVAQFRAANVTTVLMLTDPLFSATLTSAATGQSYYPEWTVSSIGFNDVAFVVEHFYDKQQQKNVSGASFLSSSSALPWHEQPAYKAWKAVNPDREPPGDWNNWYLQIQVLYAGILGAGPQLSPTSFLAGLARTCGPCTRNNSKDVLLGFGPGDTTGVDDFTIVQFNPSKPDYHDPGDGTGRQAIGDWDFPEKGLRYYRTINSPER